MKINYKNTGLSFLEKWDEEINIPEGHKPMTQQEDRAFGRSVMEGLEDGKALFSGKIQYISQPFWEAYQKGKHKLAEVFDKEEMEEGGTFIWQFGSFTFTTFYYLKSYIHDNVWKADYMIIQFSKHSKNDYKGLDVCISGNDGVEKTFIWKGHYDTGHTHDWYFSWLVTFLCFIKHVELETKIIPSKSKANHIGVKYVNDTKNKIEVLDSTWFTTIVKSEGFGVRGHFRFQPYGPKMSDKKLIWIAAYEKEGYTRTAKIVRND